MPKIPYTKPATTYAKQVQMLKDRGMVVEDDALALHTLQHYNYYRLAAYWLPFEDDHNSHTFKAGTRFEDVLRLYDFDRRLRLLLLDAIERIEVSVRGQWAYRMGHLHGAHAHLDSRLAKNQYHWQKNRDALEKEVARAEEIFIKHLTTKYAEDLPPVWAVCEVMTLGVLSRWYTNLKQPHTRRMIAGVYDLDERVLESWLHHLSIVRNVCAHHSRLWNRDFGRVLPMHPQNKPARLKGAFVASPHLYNTLILMLHFMDKAVPTCTWRTRLKELLLEHQDCLPDMGFPTDWQDQGIWQ